MDLEKSHNWAGELWTYFKYLQRIQKISLWRQLCSSNALMLLLLSKCWVFKEHWEFLHLFSYYTSIMLFWLSAVMNSNDEVCCCPPCKSSVTDSSFARLWQMYHLLESRVLRWEVTCWWNTTAKIVRVVLYWSNLFCNGEVSNFCKCLRFLINQLLTRKITKFNRRLLLHYKPVCLWFW